MNIDLNCRPTSYIDFDDPVALVVNGINGQLRREMARDMLTAEGEKRAAYDALLGPIDPGILEERSSESFFRGMARVDPTWLGGEFLPTLKPGEVEIARIVLQSSTMDVTSVRARWRSGRYHYRVVDEYGEHEGDSYRLCRKTSVRTLTLGQLIEVIETAECDLVHGVGLVELWWNQQRAYGDDPQKCTDFAWVESEQYPTLSEYYEWRAEAWRINFVSELLKEGLKD